MTRSPHPPRRRPAIVIGAASAATCAGLVAAALLPAGSATAGAPPHLPGPPTRPSSTATAAPAWEPAPDTIVGVDGDAESGFEIRHYDGTSLYPPTMSESIAECGEYDTEVQVAVCEAETRTWFRDLAATQAAIEWARYDAAR
ncbi:hypothetical protein [Nocardioides sp.]|uniref:hypothetical protein n=1 Tax=Nocardioides sp. TaxID=35761 RepID=UPI00351291B4